MEGLFLPHVDHSSHTFGRSLFLPYFFFQPPPHKKWGLILKLNSLSLILFILIYDLMEELTFFLFVLFVTGDEDIDSFKFL